MPPRASTSPAPLASIVTTAPTVAVSIEALIAQRQLRAVFQPIVDFGDGAILGYESIIRGPAGSPLETPAAS